MKNIYEILRQKEQQSEQLQREIEALRLTIKILDAENITFPKTESRSNGNGTPAENTSLATVGPAKRFP